MSNIDHSQESAQALMDEVVAGRDLAKAHESHNASSTTYTATGTVDVVIVIFGGTLSALLTFQGGPQVQFKGSFGGLGAGGGTSNGKATFLVSPDQLLKWKTTAFQYTGSTAGVTVKWYYNNSVIGTFSGTGASGGGELGGNGSWTKVG